MKNFICNILNRKKDKLKNKVNDIALSWLDCYHSIDDTEMQETSGVCYRLSFFVEKSLHFKYEVSLRFSDEWLLKHYPLYSGNTVFPVKAPENTTMDHESYYVFGRMAEGKWDDEYNKNRLALIKAMKENPTFNIEIKRDRIILNL